VAAILVAAATVLGLIAWLAGSQASGPDSVLFLVTNAGSGAAILFGVVARRPARIGAWLAIAGAMALYTLADLTQILAGNLADPNLGLAAQGLYILGYPLFFAAALRFAAGARRIDPFALIDTAIVGLGSALVVWELLVEPNVGTSLSDQAAAFAVGYPVVAIVLVSLVLPLVLVRQTRSTSAILLLAGLASVALADARFALAYLDGSVVHADLVSNAGWLGGYLMLGLAGAVPSAASLGSLDAPPVMRNDRLRPLVLSVALLAPPLLFLLEAGTATPRELRLFALDATLLALLVIIRLQRTLADSITSDARFRRFMSHDGFMAAIKDGAGRYRFLNPLGEQLSGLEPGSWYGRTDAELVEPRLAEHRRLADDHVRLTGEPQVEATELAGRTILSERFPMPGNHGSIGILGMDITERVKAEDRLRAAQRTTDRWTRERALIAETLTALEAGRTPEATADAVCVSIIRLPEIAIATIVTFGGDGRATVLGQAVSEGEARSGLPLPEERGAYLRERAAAGPWVERWVGVPDHPYAPMLERLGVRAHAFAPLTQSGEVVGVLIVGSAAPDASSRLTERLPALAEFGHIAGALLGSQLADRRATARAAAEVREIVEGAAFDIAFQPIVELATGEVPGYEALARFRDGVSPEDHFRRAREVGLGTQLERATLQAAIAASSHLEAGAWLNLNVSPELVLSDALVGLLPLPDRVVVLEVTEHEAITDYDAFRAAVSRLDGRVRVCVDDAGAGYASLRHIVELEPVFVKLDRSLIAGIGSDAARQAVVVGMVRFAETAGLTLIAEGIETVDELLALRRASVPLGQGYLLGRPEVPIAPA
jgi:EAL domain-containing protein (putative c-di-GMP-specific phosphodiesterase class I)